MAGRKKPAKRGRPSSYRKEFAGQAYKLCLLGAIDKELADFFEVSEQTLNSWKKEFPEFLESLKNGKIIADATVSESLFKRANGYTHPEEKIFCVEGAIIRAETTKHYPPDTLAIAYWMNNRQSAKWRRNVPEGYGDPQVPTPVKVVVNVVDASRDAKS